MSVLGATMNHEDRRIQADAAAELPYAKCLSVGLVLIMFILFMACIMKHILVHLLYTTPER